MPNSGSNSQRPSRWQQLPLVKHDMSGIHNLNLTKEWADSMNHFVSCHVLQRSEKDWPHTSLESCCFLDHSLILELGVGQRSKALRDPILTPCLMVKITTSSKPHPHSLSWDQSSIGVTQFPERNPFPLIKKKKLSKSVFTEKKLYAVLHFSVTWTILNSEWKTAQTVLICLTNLTPTLISCRTISHMNT